MLKFDLLIFGDSENDREYAEKLKCDFIGLKNEFSDYKVNPKKIIRN